MFGIGFAELLIILAVLVLFIGVPLVGLVIVAIILIRDRQHKREAARNGDGTVA
jgi:hypothetical protein